MGDNVYAYLLLNVRTDHLEKSDLVKSVKICIILPKLLWSQYLLRNAFEIKSKLVKPTASRC